MAEQKPRTLQEALDAAKSVVDYLWANPKSNAALLLHRWPPSVVPVEVTNWRREQEAWTQSVVLFDQSYHMPELHIRGEQPLRALEPLCVNNLSRVTPGVARHIVCCTPRGHIIGDNILYCLDNHHVVLVSTEPVLNWVQYHLAQWKAPVEWERDENWANNPTGFRHFYRYEIAGPSALALLQTLVDGDLPEIAYFHVETVSMRGHIARVLHHNMAGVPGFEISGPWEERDAVKSLLMEAGRALGIRHAGLLAYTSACMESGWVPQPLPAIYSDPALRPYRQWLPATGMEGARSLGGSFYSPNIEDYYLNPWDLSYSHLIKYDHDFIGREALQEMAKEPHRRRVTLVWNPQDVLGVYETYLQPGTPALFLEWPVLWYGWRYDKVLAPDGQLVGFGINQTGYSINERAVLTFGVVEEGWSTPGTQLVLVWGELSDHAPGNPELGCHRQREIRVTVEPSPIGHLARQHRQQVARWSLS